jgi:WD40 repeat protein
VTLAPAETTSRPSTLPEVPFPGLDWFGEEYGPYFFGRDSDVKVIVSNLEASRLTLLYGASGVGKSSLLLAGVVRGLRRRAVDEIIRRRRRREDAGRTDGPDVAKFAITEFRTWVDEPLPQLMNHVRLMAMEALGGEELPPWNPDDPSDDPVERLREWTTRVRFLYIVLDQFEEYFLYHPPSTESGSFDVELARLVNEPGLHVHVVLSLREDALALLDRFKPTIPRLYDNYLRIDHLDLKAADRAIRGPVDAYNAFHDTEFAVEDALVQRLLESPELRAHRALGADAPLALASDGAATPRLETPYLQLVLRRLWETERERGSTRLRLETLDDLGGPRKIVKGHLDAAMEELSADEQEIAVEIFHQLVTPSKSKIAHAAADLADYVNLPESAVTPVLDKLCAGNRILRRIVAPGDASTDGDGAERARYEIFHDVLAEPILAWRAQKLAERTEAEEHEAEQRAFKRRTRRFAIAGGVLLLAVVVVGAAVSVVFNVRAISAQHSSRSQALAAAALAQAESDPATALGTALHAMRVKATPAASVALMTILPESRLRSILPSPGWVTAAGLGGPGGRYVALGSQNGDVRIWNWRTKRELVRLHQPSWVTAVQFAQGGKLLFTASGASTQAHNLQLWDLADCVGKKRCKPVQSWTGSNPEAEISADGRWIVNSYGGGAQLWDVGSCEHTSCRATSLSGTSTAVGVATQNVPHRGGAVVAAAEKNGSVLVWTRRDGHYPLELHLPTPWGADIGGVAISPNAKLLAAFGDRSVLVWDLTRCTSSTACAIVLQGRAGDWMQALAFSPDSASVATASEDGVARIWNLLQPTSPLELHGLHGIVFSIAFSPDGRYLVSGGDNGEGSVWDVGSGSVVARADTWATSAEFDRSGRRILTTTFTGGIAVRDRGGHVLAMLRLPYQGDARHRAALAVFAPDGTHVYGSDASGASVWDLRTCSAGVACVGSSLTRANANAGVAVSREGKLLAVGEVDDNAWAIRLVAAATGRTLWTYYAPDQPTSAAFSPRAPVLAMSTADGSIRLWNVAKCVGTSVCNPRLLRVIRVPTIVFGIAFSPDGRRLAAGSDDGIGRIWDWQNTSATPLELVGHTSNIRSIAFSADGSRVVTGGTDTTIRIWDAHTGSQLAILRSHADKIESVMFDPRNSSQVLSASDDGTVRISTCETCRSQSEVLALANARRAQATRHATWLPTDRGRTVAHTADGTR